MGITLKPVEVQVIVITGATSGIGLVTARMAAKRGARLVLASRSEAALQKLAEEIREANGEATYVVADVGDEVMYSELPQLPESVSVVSTRGSTTRAFPSTESLRKCRLLISVASSRQITGASCMARSRR